MKYFWLFFFLLLSVIAQPASVQARNQTFKVMTFNPERDDENPGFSKCESLLGVHKSIAQGKATDIAQYIKRNNIEIALVQELYRRCNDPLTFEYELLAAELQRIGYPMYSVSVPYTDQYGTFFQVATFSVYPVNTSGVKYIPTYNAVGDTNVERWGLATNIITDVGEISIFNIHIQTRTACNGIRDFFGAFESYPGLTKIMGGDFNKDLPKNDCRDITNSYTLNRDGDAIDYILFPKNAPFSFVSTIVDTSSTAPNSDHDPVVSVISTSLSNGQVSPFPTAGPTEDPTVTPVAPDTCRLRSYGDADCKNTIDLIDFICWKEEFLFGRKSSQCISSDFNLSEGVTIADLMIWMQNFRIANNR